MSHRVTTVSEYFDTLDRRFVPEAAQGVHAVYEFRLDGADGGVWHVSVQNGAFEVHSGPHPRPTTTIAMSGSDYVRMVNGKLNGPMAFMTGKLKVSGSIPAAQQLQRIFPPAS